MAGWELETFRNKKELRIVFIDPMMKRAPPIKKETINDPSIPYLGRLHAEDAAETRVCEIREAAIREERVIHLNE